MEVLAWTRLGTTISGQQELVDITVEQAELSEPFKHTNVEQWNRLVQCIKHALPFFSVNIINQIFKSHFLFIYKIYNNVFIF